MPTGSRTWSVIPVENSALFNSIGNMVFIHAALTYPSTASGAGSQLNISGMDVNFLAANACYITTANVATAARLFSSASSTTLNVINTVGGIFTNAAISLGIMSFACVYPAS